MNEFDPSLDEIVSAYVDGVATPHERARVEGDPALVERAATFRRVQDALATPTAAASDELRNTLIARALADAAAPTATVLPMRNRRATTLGPIVAAAAVIAMFFGLGTWLVASQDNNDADQSTAAGAPSVAEDLFDAKNQLNAPAATTPPAAAGAGATTNATTESAKLAPVYLGGFNDETALGQALVRTRDQSGSTPATVPQARTATDTPSCPRTDSPEAKIYSAELRGRSVTIVVTGTRADVYDNATCAQSTLDLTKR
ncbi:MAG: hypothetical protein ABIQ73_20510 [Acidimicrobiales bacterium]